MGENIKMVQAPSAQKKAPRVRKQRIQSERTSWRHAESKKKLWHAVIVLAIASTVAGRWKTPSTADEPVARLAENEKKQ